MLEQLDRRILDFERSWWHLPGTKERAIVELLGMDVAAYYRRLRLLLDRGDAAEYDPLTVLRLRRWIGAA